MHIFLGLFGCFLIAFTSFDVIVTTLALNRGGPLTARVSRWIWYGLLRLHRLVSIHWLLAQAGLLIILTAAMLWVLFTWVGWTLIFNMSSTAVVESQSKQPADIWARIYFIGYTIITLGTGDYIPQGRVWRLLTPITSANGFFLVTLAITYFIPIVSGAVQKRQLALYIHGLGATAEEILLRAWNGQDFGMLSQHLTSLTPMILQHGQQYLGYPVLRHIHSPSLESAVSLHIVVLDEMLTLLEHGVDAAYQPDPVALYPLRHAITQFLNVLHSEFIEPAKEPPPAPNLAKLRACGIPLDTEQDFQHAVDHLAERRRQLLAIVHDDGWTWSEVR